MSDTLEKSIEILEANYIPYLHEILEATVNLFEKAKKHRDKCLISNTVGTVSSSIGGCIGFGALLAGIFFTGGVAAIPILAGVGIALGAAGSITSLGTVAVSRSLERSDKNVVELLLDDFKTRRIQVLNILLQFLDEYDDYVKLFPNILNFTNQNLANLGLWKDEKVTMDEIRHGDHILRPIALVPLAFHHGICIQRGAGSPLEVVDYGPHGVRIRPMNKFLKNSDSIKKRNYNGLELTMLETFSLMAKELSPDVQTEWSSDAYNVASHNCEHFASFLKQGRTRSRQIHAVARGGVGATMVAKVGQCTAGIVSLVGKVGANSANIALKPALITQRAETKPSVTREDSAED
ncbi:HRAS-like suppressor 3 [Folsomia candida]|uniref:HRAS-like suppressor 3 n=1 Tax=Folsomia candida TaxID=158441 RepID=A0A226D0Z8_FOLCA|nr:HRAS-like suppressor 3 [Folsomia candida]